MYKWIWIVIFFAVLTSCVPPPPHNTRDICSIFRQCPRWYWDAQKSAKKWGVPVVVQMAIIDQESHFKGIAKPPHKKLLGVLPWISRESSSYGYTQALESTWIRYEQETGNFGDRDDFSKATDFVAWFCYMAHKKLGIPRNNIYALYLAYHEGLEGFQEGTYWHKPWLRQVARKVEHRARVYQWQLNHCHSQLKKEHWWNFL